MDSGKVGHPVFPGVCDSFSAILAHHVELEWPVCLPLELVRSWRTGRAKLGLCISSVCTVVWQMMVVQSILWGE